ncbi:MAG: hypothetical protein FJ294_09980 [Planctomycetes bacterium]|nr:hypothetical protein [Planctomycetota bacterium]
MLSALLLAFVPVPGLAFSGSPSQGEAQLERSDADARRAFGFLTPAEQADCIEELSAELEWLDTFQLRLVRYARTLDERDPGLLPLERETPYFDPTEHAPGQPIARKRLAPDAASARKTRERILRRVPQSPLSASYRYDWGQGEIVRSAVAPDAQRVFDNALAGFAPGHDLALALVERALDDGSQRAALDAFDHAYTDRSGNVYPGITLYDAWASGEEMEMPDVDILGVVHTLLGIRDRWIAPVPDREHNELYATVGTLFRSAQRHRGLRSAIAATFLESAPKLPGSYPTSIERFHGLWESCASTPSEVAKRLPDPERWSEFLVECSTRTSGDPKLLAAAQLRQATLAADARAVRALLGRLLEQRGAFERKERPAPPQPKKD